MGDCSFYLYYMAYISKYQSFFRESNVGSLFVCKERSRK
nr:MAG TPA: hypothetical protein [Caudoviricetes sp.]